ncbi:MAG: hypothetical protein RBG13Loki_2758 [Promethearchaeota archaeon CR_4]|nr:MAG: hypothetical protein RBG13Loki_2758 [Candidatus Lokiarchaeota archaeon CR_4]
MISSSGQKEEVKQQNDGQNQNIGEYGGIGQEGRKLTKFTRERHGNRSIIAFGIIPTLEVVKTARRRQERCCTNPRIVEVGGTRVCAHCGCVDLELVFEDSNRYKKDRNGNPISHTESINQDNSFPPTIIPNGHVDARGHMLSDHVAELFSRLRERNKWGCKGPMRTLQKADYIRRGILSRLGFRDPRKISWEICHWVAKHRISQGRTLEATTAGAIYVAAVEQDFPITCEQVCMTSHVHPNALRNVVRYYLTQPRGTKKNFPVLLTRSKYFTPGRVIRRICAELNLAPRVVAQALEYAQQLEKLHSSGHRPENKAATCVKAVVGSAISWKELARITGVQVSSLKDYWKKAKP